MADSKISNLSSASALTGTEEVPVVQSSTTVKTTAQDIANLASSANIGNSDLTVSASGTRKLILNNVNSTDKFSVRNSADTKDILTVQGDEVTTILHTEISSQSSGSSPLLVKNSSATNIVEVLDSSGHGALRVKNSSGQNVFDLASGLKVFDMPRSGEYDFRLGGDLSTDKIVFQNDSANVLLTINGIGQVIPNGVGSISTNTILGEAGSSITTGGFNSVLGHQALDSITTQSYNVAIGHQAMQTATTSQSVAVGHTALQKSSGTNNTAVGVNSMTNNTTGQGNTAVGHTSLNDNTTGIFNTAVGFESLSLVTTNGYNTAVGHSAGKSSTGQQNTFLGFSTGRNTTGNFCTFSGVNSGYENTSGQYNTFYGHDSGRGITTGSYNTVIGVISGLTSTTSNNIIISDGQANRGLTKDANDNIYFGDASALATTATDGFTYIRGGAGTPTGTPATSITGHVPLFADTTNNKLYIYSGGSWVALN